MIILKEYIAELQEIFDKHGNLPMYTARDDEGNGYNIAGYSPEVRLLSDSEDSYRPDSLLSQRKDTQSIEDYCDKNCIDEEDIASLHMVVLL